MAPTTALRMVDIHSSAARLLPKPMLPNAANSVRMIIRRPKRAITWVDLSCCDRFGSCAKCQGPDGYALRGRRDTHRRHTDAASRDNGSFAPSGEIVGQQRLVRRARGTMGTLVLLDGAAMCWASTNALKIASGKSG